MKKLAILTSMPNMYNALINLQKQAHVTAVAVPIIVIDTGLLMQSLSRLQGEELIGVNLDVTAGAGLFYAQLYDVAIKRVR